MTDIEKMQRLAMDLLQTAIPAAVAGCAIAQTDAATGVTVLVVGYDCPDGGLDCLRHHLQARKARQQREVVH